MERFLQEWWGLIASIGGIMVGFGTAIWRRSEHEEKQESKLKSLQEYVERLEERAIAHEQKDSLFRDRVDKRMTIIEERNNNFDVRLGKIEVMLEAQNKMLEKIYSKVIE